MKGSGEGIFKAGLKMVGDAIEDVGGTVRNEYKKSAGVSKQSGTSGEDKTNAKKTGKEKIAELQEKIDGLEDEVSKLKRENAGLRNQNKQLNKILKKYLENQKKGAPDDVNELEKTIQDLETKSKELRGKNKKLLGEKKQILENSSKLALYLRRMLEQEEEWNHKGGKFFGYIVLDLQKFYGCLDAEDMEQAEIMLKNLKNTACCSRRMLQKGSQPKEDKEADWKLKTKELDEELRNIEEIMERRGKNVLYQNLLFPLLCLLMDADLQGDGGMLKKEMNEILQAEGLQALYRHELPTDDVENRSLFSEINRGVEAPGIFRMKEGGGYEIFGNALGLIKRDGTKDE